MLENIRPTERRTREKILCRDFITLDRSEIFIRTEENRVYIYLESNFQRAAVYRRTRVTARKIGEQ